MATTVTGPSTAGGAGVPATGHAAVVGALQQIDAERQHWARVLRVIGLGLLSATATLVIAGIYGLLARESDPSGPAIALGRIELSHVLTMLAIVLTAASALRAAVGASMNAARQDAERSGRRGVPELVAQLLVYVAWLVGGAGALAAVQAGSPESVDVLPTLGPLVLASCAALIAADASCCALDARVDAEIARARALVRLRRWHLTARRLADGTRASRVRERIADAALSFVVIPATLALVAAVMVEVGVAVRVGLIALVIAISWHLLVALLVSSLAAHEWLPSAVLVLVAGTAWLSVTLDLFVGLGTRVFEQLATFDQVVSAATLALGTTMWSIWGAVRNGQRQRSRAGGVRRGLVLELALWWHVTQHRPRRAHAARKTKGYGRASVLACAAFFPAGLVIEQTRRGTGASAWRTGRVLAFIVPAGLFVGLLVWAARAGG